MSNQDKEIRRLQELRKRQLQTRDPHKKQRRLQQDISQTFKSRKNYTLADGVSDLSHKIKGFIIGIIIGMVAAILLWAFVQAAWADLIGILAILLFAALGLLLGSSFDWRDNLRDL